MRTLSSLQYAYIFRLACLALATASCGKSDPSDSNLTPTHSPTLATGTSHTCAIVESGTVKCWGENLAGALGNDTIENSSSPVTVTGISTATAVTAGNGWSCALLQGGSIDCWGANSFGKLGNGLQADSWKPVKVSGISDAVRVFAGQFHTCAVLGGGEIKCWGENMQGALGDGTTNDSSTPVTVSGISNAVAVSASCGNTDETCAVLADGTVKCWGDNTYGQLGDGTTNNSLVPVSVVGVTDAVGISVGGSTACALLAHGRIECWGSNGNELGNGTTTIAGFSAPSPVSGVTSAIDVSASSASCALLAGGTVRCWGNNAYGRLGNGTTLDSNVPIEVPGITHANAIATHGGRHACAAMADGQVLCWGDNGYGELGDGSTTASWVPVAVKFASADGG